MFRTVLIEKELPRATEQLNSIFFDGLHFMKYLGLFLCVGAILLLIISLLKFKMIAPAIIFVAMAIGGFYLFNKSNKVAQDREVLFRNGEITTAIVKDHGRQFSMFKSARDYTILVQPQGSDKTIKVVHRKKGLWNASPIGSEILGLHKNGKYFFGEEIECQFKLPK